MCTVIFSSFLLGWKKIYSKEMNTFASIYLTPQEAKMWHKVGLMKIIG